MSDGEAAGYVRQGYTFCPKSEWKTNIRDFGKEKPTEKKSKDQA